MKENSKEGVANSIFIQFTLVGSLRGSLNTALVFIQPQGPQNPCFPQWGAAPGDKKSTLSRQIYKTGWLCAVRQSVTPLWPKSEGENHKPASQQIRITYGLKKVNCVNKYLLLQELKISQSNFHDATPCYPTLT